MPGSSSSRQRRESVSRCFGQSAVESLTVRAIRRQRSLQFFHQHLRLAAALLVFFATRQGQIVGGAFDETAFRLEVGERLGREREQFVEAEFARFAFGELDQFAANALVFVRGVDVEAGKLALLLIGIDLQGDAGDRVFIDLEYVEIADVLLDARARTLDEFLRLHGLLGQHLNRANILLFGRTNLLVFVGVDERADAFVGKNLGEQTFIDASVDDVNPLDSLLAGGGGVQRFGQDFRGKEALVLREQVCQFADEHLADQLTLVNQTFLRADVNQLDRAQSFG